MWKTAERCLSVGMGIPHGLMMAVLIGLLVLAQGARAQDSSGETLARIAAVVDGTVITERAVAQRTQLTILAAGLSQDSARQQLRDRIVRDLVDEALQRQAAKDAGISLADGAVARAYRRLADQNDLSPDQLDQVLARNDVVPATLKRRLEANLLWQRYLSRELSRDVDISDQRIDTYRERLKANRGEPEYRLAEIVLTRGRAAEQAETADSADTGTEQSESSEAVALARELVGEIRQGADFAELARQFSDAANAADGGQVGWVQPGQVDESVRQRLAELDVGKVTDPIRDADTVRIYKLLDRRRILTPSPEEIQLELSRLVLNGDEPQAEAARLRAEVDSCAAFNQAAREAGGSRSGPLGSLALAELPQELQDVLAPLEAGDISEPVRRNGKLSLFMVCDRQTPDVSLPSRESVRRQLANEQLRRLAQRRLRELRREAYIDVRL